jgi:predicted phosphodiesterase
MNHKSLVILGDVHGKYRRLHEILRKKNKYPRIVQVGDFGFDYATLDNISVNQFVFFGGNHDNYDKINSCPNNLGDYGYVENFGGCSFFFIRGAYSIDKMYRTIGIDWWKNEELDATNFENALALYSSIKPNIMLTHDCPLDMYDYLLEPWQQRFNNRTSYFLQQCFEVHQPKLWVFGHFHKSFDMTLKGTYFKCVNELEIYKIPEEFCC